jgi:hypothetical protein
VNVAVVNMVCSISSVGTNVRHGSRGLPVTVSERKSWEVAAIALERLEVIVSSRTEDNKVSANGDMVLYCRWRVRMVGRSRRARGVMIGPSPIASKFQILDCHRTIAVP